MARKILGQAYPAAGQLVDVYTVPDDKSATLSTVLVCNQGTSTARFYLTAAKAGAANTAQQYLYYSVPVSPYDTFAATIGGTLAETDVLRFQSTGLMSVNVFGDEG